MHAAKPRQIGGEARLHAIVSLKVVVRQIAVQLLHLHGWRIQVLVRLAVAVHQKVYWELVVVGNCGGLGELSGLHRLGLIMLN